MNISSDSNYLLVPKT